MNKKQIDAELGERFYIVRRSREITQVQMAKYIRKTRTSVTNIERGRQHFTLWTIVQMCEVLKIEPWQILHPKWHELLDVEPDR